MKAHNWKDKCWDAEFADGWTACRFLEVLKSFDIKWIDADIEDSRFEISVVRFFATEDERKQIEYVFRRILRKSQVYLMDVQTYMNNRQKWEDDNYVIY